MRLWASGLVALMLAGCQMAGFGGGAEAPPTNPITGDAVEVTVLGPPAGGNAPAAAVASAPAGAAAHAVAPLPAEAATSEEAAAENTPAETTPAETTPPEEAAAPAGEEVARVLSPAGLACERRGGVWSSAAGGAAFFCQMKMRDAGKSCTRASDCAGHCLARSRSCAPVMPIFGCHEILNDFGQVLTECVN